MRLLLDKNFSKILFNLAVIFTDFKSNTITPNVSN